MKLSTVGDADRACASAPRASPSSCARETPTDAGELVTEAYSTTFVRGAERGRGRRRGRPRARLRRGAARARSRDASVEQTYDADQTFRYAEASGDPMQIHLDEEFAKAVGMPGIIIHGLCTMAFTSVAAIESFCPDDPSRLKRLAVRFSRSPSRSRRSPRASGTAGERDGRAAYAYETTSDSGDVVIKDGLAEIA